MESKQNDKKFELKKILQSSKSNKDPSMPTTSKDVGHIVVDKKGISEPTKHWYRKCFNFLYNRNDKTICGRTCRSWLCIIAYSIMYLIFLSAYTMVFLYATLSIIKMSGDYHLIDKTELLTYSDHGIGLSAIPTGVNNLPLIWYKDGDSNDYQKYVNAIDELLSANRGNRDAKNFSNLGPCGRSPYGYGDKPCVIIKINKQLGWSVKPIDLNPTNVQNVNSTNVQNVPAKLKNLLKFEQRKLLLNCDGYHQYDKEHVGKISYFPDPPGIDANIFPLDMQDNSPLIAIQISDFTLGISIAIECKLWYEGGPSSVQFLLYVSPMTTVV